MDEIQKSIKAIENEKDFSIEGKEKSDYNIYYKYLNGIFNILEEDSLQYFKIFINSFVFNIFMRNYMI